MARAIRFATMTSTTDSQVPSSEQLILEIYCSNLSKSHSFYVDKLGFRTIRTSPTFIVVQYESSQLFLCSDDPAPRPTEGCFAGNIRIMVNDVDDVWKRLGDVEKLLDIEDREYGLRDFTIKGPDGIAIRFASRITGAREHSDV